MPNNPPPLETLPFINLGAMQKLFLIHINKSSATKELFKKIRPQSGTAITLRAFEGVANNDGRSRPPLFYSDTTNSLQVAFAILLLGDGLRENRLNRTVCTALFRTYEPSPALLRFADQSDILKCCHAFAPHRGCRLPRQY
jgi:hypothetical protein